MTRGGLIIATADFALQLAPLLQSCHGNDGHCANPVEYAAEMAYCVCGDGSWSEHVGMDPDEHFADKLDDVLLCRNCAAVIRTWPALASMRSVR